MRKHGSRLCVLVAAVSLPGGVALAAAAQAPAQEPGHVREIFAGRGDRLILKTMSREEMLDLILDSFEESLHEFEPVWVQETPETGSWKMPRIIRSTYGRSQKSECVAPGIVYGLLLVERDKPLYAGKYPRERILKHYLDFRRGYPILRGFEYKDAGGEYYKYLDSRIGRGRPAWPKPKPPRPPADPPAERQKYFAYAQSMGARGGHYGTQRAGVRAFDFRLDARNFPASVQYSRFLYANLCYWAMPQDRAVRWAAVEGRTLAELRSKGNAAFLPDHTTQEHDHLSWHYILHWPGTVHYYPTMLTAAVGIAPERLPPPYNLRKYPDLCRGFIGYVRVLLRNHVAADGSVIWPFGFVEYSPQISFLTYIAHDATANRDPVSAAYLSRVLQHTLYKCRRPFYQHPDARSLGHPGGVRQVVTVYYMIKNWRPPEKPPSWAEAQAGDGGVCWFRHQDITVHRNPYKVIQVRAGARSRRESGYLASRFPVCNFSPTPWKAGHGMEFLQQFQNYRQLDHVRYSTRPSEAWTKAEVQKVRKLLAPEKWRRRKSSIWGDYDNPQFRYGAAVDLKTRRTARWDDGFRLVFRHSASRGAIKRALFSLGGRLTAVIEESPTYPGRMVPMQFMVHNLNCKSTRAGTAPKTGWNIHLPGKAARFADFQETKEHEPATVSASTRWYNVDDLLAVALPKPLPLMMGTGQFPDVRDTIYFGPNKGISAIVYSGAEARDMPALAAEVKEIEGLPKRWKGLRGRAPEGYRVFAIAKFAEGTDEWTYTGREAEGAPVFSVPTELGPDGTAKATFSLTGPLGAFSEEPHFFVTAVEGANVTARGLHHRLEFEAGPAPAKVTVRFFGGRGEGKVEVRGTSGAPAEGDAAALRKNGITIGLPAGKAVHLTVTGTGDDDLTGPQVRITSPLWRPKRHVDFWEPIEGKFTFKAEAFDRSGVAKVRFYLNNGQLIGTDTEAPYECEYEIGDTFCQYVYAVAYDKVDNRRRSFDVPFGDGTIGPSMLKK